MSDNERINNENISLNNNQGGSNEVLVRRIDFTHFLNNNQVPVKILLIHEDIDM